MRYLLNNLKKWWKSPFLYKCRNAAYKDLPFPGVLNNIWYLQALYTIPLVACSSKLFLGWCSSIEVHNRELLYKHVSNRSPTTPLITVANHTSMLDDPVLVSFLCKWKWLFNAKLMRWGLGAKELLFNNKLTVYIMTHGKVIPIVRGDGIYQQGLSFAIDQLNKGQWVHIFPEAKLTLDPIRLKWGVGRMISECVHQPVVLPFWHAGMEDVYPTIKPYYPRFGKKVTVLFGEPIRYQDVLVQCKHDKCSEVVTQKVLTDLVEEELYKLKGEAERLHRRRDQM